MKAPALAIAFAAGLSACAGSGPARSAESSAAASPAALSSDVVPLTDIHSEEPWRFAGADGAIIRTAHYRIYTTASHALQDRAPAFLEYALAHYRSALGPLPLPAVRLDTYLLANRGQWAGLTRQLMGEQAETLLKIPRGGYAARGVGVFFDIGLYDTLAIAAHEGWHQYTQRAFREPLPVWLEEGVAVYMEGHRWDGPVPRFYPWANLQRFDQLRKAHRAGTLAPLSKLLEGKPQDFLGGEEELILNYYAQLWALTHFLAEGADGRYAEQVRTLLADAAAGRLSATVGRSSGGGAARALASRVGPAVFLAYFNSDLETADREYASFLDRLVETGARDAIARGLSPLGSNRR